LVWVLLDWQRLGKPTVFGALSGFVAGLVAITPAAGYVAPAAALIIGAAAASLCYLAVLLKDRLRYDDALDVFGIHGIAGVVGSLLTGVFASSAINNNAKDGLAFGNTDLLLAQSAAVVVSATFAFAATLLVLKFVDIVVGIRVSLAEESAGLDAALHGETAYRPENK
jgi:Amt family ammonium transporter